MNRVPVALSLVLFLFVTGIQPAAGADDAWGEIKTEHFLVRFKGSREKAESVAKKAEEYYTSICARLGLTRYGGFWLWDRRARILIYRDRAEYLTVENAPGWAGGEASTAERRICSYENHPAFEEALLPHEITHIIFREYVGLNAMIPIWLNEGIAQLQEAGKREKADLFARSLARQGRLMSIADMNGVSAANLQTSGDAAGFYLQAVSLADYLLSSGGSARFRVFCGHLRDGKDIEGALKFTYPDRLRSIAELEKAWKKHLEGQQ